MKITVQRDDLFAAVRTATFITDRRNTIPILGNILLGTKANSGESVLQITATDLDIDLTVSIPATIEARGSTTISAIHFGNLVEHLSGPITLETDKDNYRLKVSSADIEASLTTMHPSDFPSQQVPESWPCEFSADASQLCATLKMLRHAISSEEVRFYLNGVYFHAPKDGPLRLVATNGHMLAMQETSVDPKQPLSVIVPKKAVRALVNSFEGYSGPVSAKFADLKVEFVAANVTILAKLIDGTFPDYERVMPKNQTRFVKIEAAALAKAVETVSTVGRNRDYAVTLDIGSLETGISINHPDIGSAKRKLLSQLRGEPLTLGFKIDYLGQLLREVPDGDVEFALVDSASPALISAASKPGAKFVLMPMRIIQPKGCP